jgi:Helix-hairpin-helix motif
MSVLVAFVLFASVGAIAMPDPVSASTPPAGVTGPQVPQVPGQQPALTMACAPGQVDLNHASLAALQTLPDVPLPVAQRVVAQRPHDRVVDLLTVAGIGPDTLNAIVATGKACSTPLTLPPPATNVCVTGQIDVNNPASQTALASLFGGPTAQRIVAALPFPDLNHAEVVLAAGAGPGKVSKYASKLCLTPEPKIFAGVNYSYVYPGSGGRDDYQGFSLVVPSGVRTAAHGQWVTITPKSTPPASNPSAPAWPSADFAVAGAPWVDGTKQVYVTEPTDPVLTEMGADGQPILVHWNDDSRTSGEEIEGPNLLVNSTANTVTAAVTHLSPIDSLSRLVQWPIEAIGNLAADARFPAPDCETAWDLDSATGDWWRDGGRVHLDSASLNLPGGIVPFTGYLLKHCVETGDNSTNATLRLKNNTRTMMSLTSFDGSSPSLGNVNIGGDLLSLAVAKAAEAVAGHPWAYPGGEVTATVPRASFNAVQMRPNVALTAVWFAMNQSPIEDVVKLVTGSPLAASISKQIQDVSDCVLSGVGVAKLATSYDSTSVANLSDTLRSVISKCITPQLFWDALAAGVKSGAVSGSLANAVSSKLDELSRYAVWARVSQWTFTGLDSLYGAAGGASAGVIGISYYAPKPDHDSLGRTVQDQCLKPDATGYGWKIDMACQDSYYSISSNPGGGVTQYNLPNGLILRDPSNGAAEFYNKDARTITSIDDGGTYLCLAKHYAVDWNPSYPAYGGSTIIVSPSMSCDNSIPDTRPFAPQNDPIAPFPNQNYNILRQPDGTAWLLLDSTHRAHIQTQSDFMCLVSGDPASKSYVYDQVTTDELNRYTEVNPDSEGSFTYCGPPVF